MEIKEQLTAIVEKYNSKNFTRILTHTYPELLAEIKLLTSKYNPSNINEMIYIILKSPPELCNNGKYPMFNTFNLGYRIGCGKGCKCARESQASKISDWYKALTAEERQIRADNVKQTSLDRYGVDNPMKSEIIKEKLKNTNLERYGVESPFQSDVIKEKIKKTNLERYGVEMPLMSEQIQEKGRQTTIKRYGGLMTHARKASYDKYDGINPFQANEVKEKRKSTMIEKYGTEHALSNTQIYSNMVQSNIAKFGRNNVMQKTIPDKTWEILNDKTKFEQVITGKTSQQIKDELNLTSTTNALKWIRHYDLMDKIRFKPNSAMEHDLKCWLDSRGIQYQQHNRLILPNHLELDFYFPQWNFAVELHGLFHHSELAGKKDQLYHQQKYIGCKIKNIQLIQIWQDEYWQHREVVLSKILYLAGLITNKIPARKCDLSILQDINLERDFMNTNHIQGFAEYRQYSLGAWYNDELVGIMSFALQKNRLELVRYATKIDSVASGLFSKMLKQSIKVFKFTGSITSLSDNRVSNGRLYLNSGFVYIEELKPDYYYTDDYNDRVHKQNGMKSKLIKRHNLPSEANQFTEWEIAEELGYDRIWDAGKVKWRFDI